MLLLFFTDTENPVISNCPASPITLKKYESLSNELQRLTRVVATDNTAVRSFTVSPTNANSSFFVSQNMRVTYTATDFNDNQKTCDIDVVVAGKNVIYSFFCVWTVLLFVSYLNSIFPSQEL